MKNKLDKKWMMIIGIVIALVAIMQIVNIVWVPQIKETSKTVIQGVLNFSYHENRGGAFGVGQGDTIGFVVINLIVIGISIRFLMLQRDKMDRKTLISLLCIMSGGISNLVDRLWHGYVIDYFDINALIPFPIFNLADIGITIGWIVLIVSLIHYWWKEVRPLKKQK